MTLLGVFRGLDLPIIELLGKALVGLSTRQGLFCPVRGVQRTGLTYYRAIRQGIGGLEHQVLEQRLFCPVRGVQRTGLTYNRAIRQGISGLEHQVLGQRLLCSVRGVQRTG